MSPQDGIATGKHAYDLAQAGSPARLSRFQTPALPRAICDIRSSDTFYLHENEGFFGSSLDRVDLGYWELSGDEVDDRDHLVLVAVAPCPTFRGLDESVHSLQGFVAGPVLLLTLQ